MTSRRVHAPGTRRSTFVDRTDWATDERVYHSPPSVALSRGGTTGADLGPFVDERIFLSEQGFPPLADDDDFTKGNNR